MHQGENLMDIDSIKQIPAENLDKSDLRYFYGTGKVIKAVVEHHKSIVKEYRDGVLTPIGDIKFSVWKEAVFRIIEINHETELFNALRMHYSKCESLPIRKEAEFWALVNYVSELYNNHSWVDYDDFQKF